MSWRKVRAYVVMDCPEFICELDEFRGDGGKQMMFLHLTVHQWTLTSFRKMEAFFKKFRECVTCPLYAVGREQDEKWVKFVTHFGFKPLTEVVCENGEPRRLFIQIQEQENVRRQPEDDKHEHQLDRDDKRQHHDQSVVSSNPVS